MWRVDQDPAVDVDSIRQRRHCGSMTSRNNCTLASGVTLQQAGSRGSTLGIGWNPTLSALNRTLELLHSSLDGAQPPQSGSTSAPTLLFAASCQVEVTRCQNETRVLHV